MASKAWSVQTGSYERKNLLGDAVVLLYDRKLSKSPGMPKIIGTLNHVPEQGDLERDVKTALEEYADLCSINTPRTDFAVWLFSGTTPFIATRQRHSRIYPVAQDGGISPELYSNLEQLGFTVSIPLVQGTSKHPFFACPKHLVIESDATFTYELQKDAQSPLDAYPGYITYDQFISL